MLGKNNLLRISLFIYPLIFWFLWDIVIYSTVLANLCVYLFIWFKKPLKTLPKNILLIFMGLSIWFYYGRWIDPEIGVNFLLAVIPLKFVEQNAPRDQLILFFGMILLLGVGMLFEKSLFYFAFVLGGLGFLFAALYSDRKSPLRLKSLMIYLLVTAPLTIILFLVFPRALSPFFYRPTPPSQGEVGYTSDVRLDEIEQLGFNSRPVFQAEINEKIPTSQLYWRGNTISSTDGWNWSSDFHDRMLTLTGKPDQGRGVKQIIKSVTTEEFMFALDRPHTFVWAGSPYSVDAVNSTRPQGRFTRVSNYTAYSDLSVEQAPERLSPLDEKKYLILPKMKRGFRERILRQFKSNHPREVVEKIRQHLFKEKFSYSLSPGRVENFDDFWFNKKVGFCSHFASAVGLILRIHQIPTRLVSGFLGGDYNPYTSIYKVSQNDAHVWVEALIDQKWVRIDPVEWIAPDRINLGGAGYIEQVLEARDRPWMTYLSALKGPRQWIEQWNVKFYNLIENYDRTSQMELASSFELDLKQFYSILPLIILLLGLVSYLWQRPFWRRRKENDFEKATRLLLSQMTVLGREENSLELGKINQFILKTDVKNKDEILQMIEQFELMVFKSEDYTGLKDWMRRFKKLI
ncbi:MAG: transglutaminaseTgpA domain-containing protein [Bacteriovoracaceae bacterium]